MVWLPCVVLAVFVVFTYIWMRRYFCSVHSDKFRTMVILGSGGHTAEMLPLISVLTDKYTPRIYVVAATDKLSEKKVLALCEEKGEQCLLERVPRAREVKQSPFTSIFSTLHEAILSFPIVFRHRPDLPMQVQSAFLTWNSSRLGTTIWIFIPVFSSICASIVRPEAMSSLGSFREQFLASVAECTMPMIVKRAG
ncbi:hypothetical protein CRM22_009021 [Opisthorchis felineus]|uniref:UDP-N-acetylglucosamine transferase subunit ALG14 n=1 Tax=Opisthorchis felineus TaxID=147828 RepID=A0A4S2L945_OPIFE|nr:hypothetical protein CRM22_009021 [Opisthorchis felineus]